MIYKTKTNSKSLFVGISSRESLKTGSRYLLSQRNNFVYIMQ